MYCATSKYNCKYCGNGYKEKFNYDRHVGFCEFSFKSLREIESDIESYDKTPTFGELFQYVKELSVRVIKLEKENQQLKQYVCKQKKQIDVLDWLNTRYDCVPGMDFTNWMTNLPIDDYLEQVFEYDLLTAMMKCFDDHFKNLEEIPIRAFTKKNAEFYIYDTSADCSEKTKKWLKILNKQLDKWFSYLSQKLVAAFKNWYESNKELIDTNEQTKEKYFDYFQKVLGGKMTDTTRNHRLRQYLFTKLKQNLNNIVELEII